MHTYALHNDVLKEAGIREHVNDLCDVSICSATQLLTQLGAARGTHPLRWHVFRSSNNVSSSLPHVMAKS